MSETQIFEPDGRAIPYTVEGDGPALVLIAGAGLNPTYLGGLAHSVSEEDFRVVRVGSRRATDAGVSMNDLARDVVDVMDHLDVADAWVGGHAFGGTVARVVALDHHDRVNGVLLLGVEGESPASPDLSGVAARFLDADVADMQRAAWAVPASVAADVPVLVVQGSDDDVLPPANGEALRVSAPDLVSVVAVEHAGHFFPATHVVATSWAIEDYLDWD